MNVTTSKMKRTIEFRGKRVDNGEWAYGDLVHDAISAYSTMIKVGIRQGGCYPDEVNPDTIGQYTGLTDRNGVKVYEGDRLSWVSSNPFSLGELRSVTVNYSEARFWCSGSIHVYLGELLAEEKCEVTGNIHESGGGEG